MLSRLSAPPCRSHCLQSSVGITGTSEPASPVSWFTPGDIVHFPCGKVLGTAQQVLAPGPSLSSSPCSLCLWPCVPAFLDHYFKREMISMFCFVFLNTIAGNAKPENLSRESSRHLPAVTTAWPCQPLLTTKCSSLNRVKGGFAQVWRQPAAFVLTVPMPMFTQV